MGKEILLVTGTAGFIGYHVGQALLQQGHQVVGLDNFNDFYAPALKQARNRELEKHANYRSISLDISDLPALQRVFAETRPTRVCHLAAQANVRYCLVNPYAYRQSNLEGFFNVLQLCTENRVERLVYASSSSVYGNLKELPFSEEQRVDTPVSLYAATKKANELMAHNYSHLFGIQTVGLRFFTVYGPWGRPDMSLWLFCDAIETGRPIRVFNHGDMQRDFTYCEDIVQGVVSTLFADGLGNYEILNLGNHRPEELMHVIALLEEALGKVAEREYLPMQPGDIKSTYADITRAQQKLGFAPATPIDQGLPRFVEWYRSHPELVAAVRQHRQSQENVA